MNQEPKCKINLGKPIVLLNGLVTDKNNYTDEQKLEMLNSKKSLKNKIPKNPCIIYHASKEQNNNDIMPLSEEEHKRKIKEEDQEKTKMKRLNLRILTQIKKMRNLLRIQK